MVFIKDNTVQSRGFFLHADLLSLPLLVGTRGLCHELEIWFWRMMKVCGSGSIASTALHSSVLGFSTKYFCSALRHAKQ